MEKGLVLNCGDRKEIDAIEKYYHMRWVLRVYLCDNYEIEKTELLKELYYRLDEKEKIFDDYMKCQEYYKDIAWNQEKQLEFRLSYEPIL